MPGEWVAPIASVWLGEVFVNRSIPKGTDSTSTSTYNGSAILKLTL